jgi:hypothetical protein
MNSLDQTLERVATAEPPADVVKAAQDRLDAVVSARMSATRTRRGKRGVHGWLVATASALVAAVAFVWLPLTPTPALAFSTVQEHLRDFQTLRVEMRQRVAGQEGAVTRISVTRDGRLRTDVGQDVSVIMNNAENRVLTLIHGEHLAVQSPLGGNAADNDSLDWLQDIRDFQGVARRLPEPRMINGQRAVGWQLQVQSLNAVLWTTDEGVPLEMVMTGTGEMRFDFRFEYDVPLPTETFSTAIPAGYSRAPAED